MAPLARLGGIAAAVAVDGGWIEVETVGRGAPVILLHGWTLDRRIWQPQVAALGGRFRLIAYDRRGFGRSSAPPDLSREVDDLLALIEACGADRPALVGMSQGGRVALAFAARHPDRLGALVLQGTPLSGVDPDPGAEEGVPIAAMAALARQGRLRAMLDLWRDHPLARITDPESQPLLDAILADYQARDLLAPGTLLEVLPDALRSIPAPTLVITGDGDTLWRRKVADVVAGHVPGAARLSIPAAGHLCNLCRPDAFNRAIADFLTAKYSA